MARCIEAIYIDGIGRELFRELVLDVGCGSPTTVRHRDGGIYHLVVEREHRAVYRKGPSQKVHGAQLAACGVPTLGQAHLTN